MLSFTIKVTTDIFFLLFSVFYLFLSSLLRVLYRQTVSLPLIHKITHNQLIIIIIIIFIDVVIMIIFVNITIIFITVFLIIILKL